MTDDAPDDVTAADLYEQGARMIDRVEAAREAAAIEDLRTRRTSGPVPCEDGDTFRGGSAVAGYVTDGSTPDEILARVREVWAEDGVEVVDIDRGDEHLAIGRLGDDGVRYEATVFVNRAVPLLTLDARLPCSPVPDGYEDEDGFYDALYDDYREAIDPGGEQVDEPLDPAPDA